MKVARRREMRARFSSGGPTLAGRELRRRGGAKSRNRLRYIASIPGAGGCGACARPGPRGLASDDVMQSPLGL